MTRAPLLISSLKNHRVKEVIKLRQRSHRDDARLMIIEGYREIRRAVSNKHYPRDLFYCDALFQGTNEGDLIQACLDCGAEPFQCSAAVFARISYRDRPDGLLAIAHQVRNPIEALSVPDSALITVAESIEKPGNLGTILRSADAAGAHAVIVCDRCTDINNPNVVRASIGTIFALPVVETTGGVAMEWLRQRGIQIVAASPHATHVYSDVDLTPATAIVVGAEQYGLSDRWLAQADLAVKIPMLGQSDSLNVASAATILLHEAVRQRGLASCSN